MKYMSRQERKRFFRETSTDKYIALKSKPLRVKVYARVSTEHESQVNALVNQKQWYTGQMYSNWSYNPEDDMYVDEGITGTQANMRDDFLRMIHDAKQDDCDFDIIVTREVSRFARNIEETFRYTRELKEYGIGVFFINDNIWSFDDSPDGILKLSLMASMAQGESKKTSERALAGQAVTRANGQPYGNGNILGYDKIHHRKNHDINPSTGLPYKTTFTYVINEAQAATVRRIYQLCIEGLGGGKIKTILINEGHKTATGTDNWQVSTINRILNNPTYMGYNAYGKSKVVDYLNHEVEYEHDIDKLELVKGDWEPIIPEAMWYQARAERQKRMLRIENSDKSVSKYGAISPENMWIRKLQCQCGVGLRREIWRKNKMSDEQIIAFTCYNQINNGSLEFRKKHNLPLDKGCDVKRVQECKLEFMAKRIFEQLLGDNKEAMQMALNMIIDCYSEEVYDNSKQIADIKKRIKEEESGKMNAAMLAAKGLVDENMLTQMLQEFDSKIQLLKNSLASYETQQAEGYSKSEALSRIKELFESEIDLSGPTVSPGIMDGLVKRIICREDSEFVWVLDFSKLHNIEQVPYFVHRTDEYRKTLVVDTNFDIFLEFDITFEEAVEYMHTRGRRIVRRGWDTIKVKVALEKN